MEPSFVTSVFHPSDFSPGSENAFAHALAVALVRQTDFTILHVGRDLTGEDDWLKFPAVRDTLERWGVLEPGSPRSAVFDRLRMRVKKVSLRGLSPLSACLGYLEENPTDLIVLATEGRDGLPGWLRPSTAERLARRSETMSLFVPKGNDGFVSLRDGTVSLRRILVPVDHSPDPNLAVAYATRVATLAASAGVHITALHVGEGSMPSLDLPDFPDGTFEAVRKSGDVVEEIERAARERDDDLIVMTTEGRDGVLDALRGSVTEQVLRRSARPLLAVPVR